MKTSIRLEAELFGCLLIVGTGCIAEGALPLILRHVALQRTRIVLLGPDEREGQKLAQRHGITYHAHTLTEENFAVELNKYLVSGDMLLNLSLGVGSLDLLVWCRNHDVLYIDSNLESWSGRPHSPMALRACALAFRGQPGSTAVISHGANPGLVTHLLKQALNRLAPDSASWADAASRLGLEVVQISEFDSHVTGRTPKFGEIFNTWSALGLFEEMLASAELGWGGHELHIPAGATAQVGRSGIALKLAEAGRETLVRSWSPRAGEFTGFLLAHHEAAAIADLLSSSKKIEGTSARRPTVFYAVRPCAVASLAAESMGPNVVPTSFFHQALKAELSDGGCELGVLLLGEKVGHWYGSYLSLTAARALASDNNAVSLQVAAGVLGAIVWALENPRRGIVEAEDMDHQRVLAVATPYLGELVAVDTPWRPTHAQHLRFSEFLLNATNQQKALEI